MDSMKSIATDLFYKIRSRFTGLKLGESMGAITINPEEAVFFDFDYIVDEQALGHVSISLAEPRSMKVYFSNGITENMDIVQKEKWYDFLRELRQFAKRRLLTFDTRDVAKDNLDQRDFAFLSQYNQTKTVGESIMSESSLYGSRTISYQNLMDTKLIIKHSKPIQDEQVGSRARNISALFVENQDGERFKYPFIHLAGARAMQRHVANGGVPYDEIGKHIVGMSEQIAQLKGFGNYVVRNDLLNSDTNSIYEKSSDALNRLREELSKLSKQAFYEQFKTNFQLQDSLEVPQDVIEDFTEKFTVKNFKEDIKSVFPILYRLMKEESKIGYDDIVAMTGNEELEIEEDFDSNLLDPFAKFESWVAYLGEDSGILSQDPDEKKIAINELNELTTQHFPAGEKGLNAIKSLEGIIEDPRLFAQIKEAAEQDPDTCVRGLVKNWLEENAPDILEELDFGDFQDEEDVEDPMQYANDAADADAVAYGQREDITAEASSSGDYELEVKTQVFFERDENGKAVISKIMLGDTDITAITSPEETADYIEDGEESPVEGIEYINVDIDYSVHGEYLPATWGYHGGSPAEYPEVEINEITAFGNGKSIKIDFNDLDGDNQNYLQEKAEEEASENGSDDGDYDDYDRYESVETSKGLEEKQSNVNELAQFIYSFYDKESGTFPKGPEGVCTMVGKKFGEQAESLARRLVEKLAPQQQSSVNPDLDRIKELSGMHQQEAAVVEGSVHGWNVAKWYAKTGDQLKLTKWLRKEAGLDKNAPVYFDDADLVYIDQTIVPEALVNPKLKMQDLLDAVKQAAQSPNEQESIENATPELESIKRLAGMR